MNIILLLSLILIYGSSHNQVSAFCCYATSGCNRCDDCTPSTPYCSTGGCNIFGCNCDGSCKTGTLCPIGAVGRRGQTVVAGPNCNIPYDRLEPHCAIVMPGRTSWEWVNACTTRGRRKRSIEGIQTDYQNAVDFKLTSVNVSTIFQAADVNSDSRLSFKEAKVYLIRMGFNQKQVRKAVLELDNDGDELLTIQELDSN